MTYRAVLFDVGETLVHPRPSFHELFAQVATLAGHRVAAADVLSASALVSRRFTQAAREDERWTTSPERSSRFWISVYTLFLEELAVPNPNGLPEALYRAFSDPTNYELFPDVRPAVEGLFRSGLRLGVVSNFEAWLEDLLGALGVRDLLSVRVISGIEGVEKPDPEIFRRALERIGVRASEAVYVGDSPTFDCEPAAAIGMLPILLDRHGRFPDHDGIRVAALGEVAEAVAR